MSGHARRGATPGGLVCAGTAGVYTARREALRSPHCPHPDPRSLPSSCDTCRPGPVPGTGLAARADSSSPAGSPASAPTQEACPGPGPSSAQNPPSTPDPLPELWTRIRGALRGFPRGPSDSALPPSLPIPAHSVCPGPHGRNPTITRAPTCCRATNQPAVKSFCFKHPGPPLPDSCSVHGRTPHQVPLLSVFAGASRPRAAPPTPLGSPEPALGDPGTPSALLMVCLPRGRTQRPLCIGASPGTTQAPPSAPGRGARLALWSTPPTTQGCRQSCGPCLPRLRHTVWPTRFQGKRIHTTDLGKKI